MNPTPLSVCIITYNEEENLPRCLASVAFADEIVVVDSQSTDRTVAIARQAGCRVISQAFLGYVAQKNLALQHASHQWVLCLDADEWLRPGAVTAIQAALATQPPDVAGYTLKRHTYYLGDWVNHSGWWPEYKIRLFDRQRGQWCGDALHEGIRVAGRVDHLDVEIGHRSYKDMAHHFNKLNTYTTIMAQDLYERGAGRVGCGTLVLHPVARFCRMFFLKGGWREGVRGLMIATIGAFYVFAKYAKLWELQHGSQQPPEEGGALSCAPSAVADAGNGGAVSCAPSAVADAGNGGAVSCAPSAVADAGNGGAVSCAPSAVADAGNGGAVSCAPSAVADAGNGGAVSCAPSAVADAGNGPCGPSADAVAEE